MDVSAISTALNSNLLTSLRRRSGSSQNDSDFEDMSSNLISQFDSDGDGLISLEESGLDQDRFTAIDTDGDGQHSQSELMTMMQSDRAARMAAQSQLSTLQIDSLAGGATQQQAASAYGQMQGMQQPPDLEQMASDLVDQLDADGDGSLSLEESGLSEDLFSQLDADGDGIVTQAELLTKMQSDQTAMQQQGGMQPPPPPSMEQMASDILSQLDADSDGSLSLEESGLSEDLFSQLDADGDGMASQAEILATLQSDQTAMQAMKPASTEQASGSSTNSLDTNGDGIISLEESGLSEEVYNAIYGSSGSSQTSQMDLLAKLMKSWGQSSGLQASSFGSGMNLQQAVSAYAYMDSMLPLDFLSSGQIQGLTV